MKQVLIFICVLSTIIGRAQFSTYSAFDVPYSVVNDVEYLMPNEIKDLNRWKSDDPDITDDDCLFYFNAARAQDNLLAAPATIVDFHFDFVENEEKYPNAKGAVQMLVEIINSTPKTIKEITLQFEFTDAAGRQLYDMKTGDKYCVLTFNNLAGRTTSTQYEDISKSIIHTYHLLDMTKASYRKLFFNSKAHEVNLRSAKIIYDDGSSTNKIALFIGTKANELLRLGPLSPAIQFAYYRAKKASINSQSEKQRRQVDEIFHSAETMPSFPGGDAALMRYINSHMIYPKETDAQGIVVVQFVVRKDGSVGTVKVARGVDPYLDAEAIRLTKSLPKFNPGKQNGQPVNVWYTLPISFKKIL